MEGIQNYVYSSLINLLNCITKGNEQVNTSMNSPFLLSPVNKIEQSIPIRIIIFL